MSKHEKPQENGGGNFWFKALLIVIVVAWIALALGNLAGRYLVNSKFFNKKPEVQVTPTPEISLNTPAFEAPAGYGKAEQVTGFTEEAKAEKKEEEKKEEEKKEVKEDNTKQKEEKKEAEKVKKEEPSAYKLQAGFYADKDNAEKTANQIKSLGFSAYVTDAQIGGKSGYKVFIGGYKNKEEAEKNKEKLKTKGIDVMLVSP